MSAGQETQHRSPFERAIEALAGSLGDSIGWLADHGVLLIAYGVIWAAVGAGLLFAEPAVREAWTFVGSQNLLLQAVLWLIFLPVMGGLWIWHTDWPLLVRIVLVAGLAGWNLLVFLPRRAGPPEAAVHEEASV